VRRREFITLLGGAAAARPVVARAQQSKRIAVLLGGVATATTGQANLKTFVQGLHKLGWVNGENLQIEARYSAGDKNLIEAYASDLVGLFRPDILVTATTANLAALQRAQNGKRAGY
jgi:putative ABC transport system substrate-binding protein